MENVEGILHGDHRLILDVALDEVPPAYEIVGPLLVSAADYGAATKRKRVVILGYLKDEFPVVSSDDLQAATAHRSSVREAISDLPRPIPASTEKDDLGWAPYPDLVERLSDYAVAARSAPPAGLGSREARDRHNAGLVSGQFETVHSDAIRERYLSIEGGRSDPITKSYKLEWEGQCPTLRAGTGRERGAFQAVRPLHPDEGRVISVREAARLQGFPDWFEFHPTKWQSFRMIGNSVSPYVSFGILQAIARKLQIRLAA
jgi:DNA (cytosine-5)-methyltransferase 1